MKLSIVGQDSLALATATCCRRHFDVLAEPGVTADILWVCYDTPTGPDNRPDADWVCAKIHGHLGQIDPTVPVLISSQLPVGTTARLEKDHPAFTFAYSPENIRVANAVSDFENQARVVVGVRNDDNNSLLNKLCAPFTRNIIFTTPETAEMSKTALNCFLALQIAWINEIARVCETVGADASVVSQAVRSDARVSPKAPLRPGAPFGGGHLERELFTLGELAMTHGVCIPIITHINESNRVSV